MEKYSKDTAKFIADMLKADSYTINEICASAKICKFTFYNWMKTHPEFAEMVENARKELKERVIIGAKRSLIRKIAGYDITETHTTTIPTGELDANGKPVAQIKSVTRITKHVEPDTTAIIFTLTSLDPDNWKNRRETTIIPKKDEKRTLTDDELNNAIAELERKLKTGR